jgi:hypothetical protein
MATAKKIRRKVPKARGIRAGKIKDDDTRMTFSITVNPSKIAEGLKRPEATPLLVQLLMLIEQEVETRGIDMGTMRKTRDRAVGSLLKALTREETLGVAKSLKGDKQILFMEIYKSYAKEDEDKAGQPKKKRPRK